VAVTSRNVTELEKQVGGHQDNLLALIVDITNGESVKNAIRQTVEHFGRLDVVVNNAGYLILGSLEEITEQEFRQSMEVNVFGTVNVIRAVMPYLRKQKSGHIINLSSSAGYMGVGNAGSYHAVKFAVIGLSEALAQEVKPFGIRVTVVAPGYFRTNFLDKGSVMVTKNRIKEYNTSQLEEAMKQMDGKQQGDPDKLVAALVKITEEPNPPLHLLMGPDAYQTITAKRKEEETEFETWKPITVSTDFEN
jgi:NAD(P)-dependent dehydrogenase (short-subunit alcohol dehydrogenase family)